MAALTHGASGDPRRPCHLKVPRPQSESRVGQSREMFLCWCPQRRTDKHHCRFPSLSSSSALHPAPQPPGDRKVLLSPEYTVVPKIKVRVGQRFIQDFDGRSGGSCSGKKGTLATLHTCTRGHAHACHICTPTHTRTWLHTCTYSHTHPCMHAQACTQSHTHLHILAHARTRTHPHTYLVSEDFRLSDLGRNGFCAESSLFP